MAARPRTRSHGPTKKLDACPECGSALTQVAPPAVRLVSSLEWSYPAPQNRQTCKGCGWTAEVA